MEEKNNIEEVKTEEIKKDKKDNKNVIIVILVVIVLLLGVFIALILTGVINFKGSNHGNSIPENTIADNQDDSNQDDDNSSSGNTFTMIVITGDGVRIRDKATSSGSKVLGVVNKNDEFELLDKNTGSSGNGCKNDWYKIDYNGNEGYLCSEFAMIEEEFIKIKEEEFDNASYINDNDASKIVEELFFNENVQYLFDCDLNYCEKFNTDEAYEYEELNKLGINTKNLKDYQYRNGLVGCKNFKSYDELINHMKKYVTDSCFNNDDGRCKRISAISSISGILDKEYFYEIDGKLYGMPYGKGGNPEKVKALKSKNKYNILSHNSDMIVSNIEAYWLGVAGNENLEKIKIVLKKVNDTWKVDSYESIILK